MFSRDRSSPGFTLIELMVVIAILGLLMATVAPNLIDKDEYARTELARIQVERIKEDVMSWMTMRRASKPPESLDVLLQPFGRSGPLRDYLPLDPWDNEYEILPHEQYRKRFVVRSFGPDGEADTEDDIRTDQKPR